MKNNYKSEEQNEIKNFIIILVIVLVFIGVIYGFSMLFIEKDNSIYGISYQTGEVNPDMVIAGTMFNRPIDEYYILAYNNKGVEAPYYSQLAKNYISKQTDATQMYYLELNSYLNKDIYSTTESNPKAKNLEELQIKDFTLIHIKKGKIVNYIEDYNTILKMLEITNPIEAE